MSFTVTDVKGAITPLVTPFHDDGVARPRRRSGGSSTGSSSAGTHGISVGGSTGEPTSQTVAERIEVMRAAVAAIDGRVPFLPGTGTARMDETLELTAEAQPLGAPAALVVTPYYGAPDPAGPVRLVQPDRDRVPGPADHRLQRADPRGGGHHAGDGRPAASRAREHRRDQGDHARLRARLLRARQCGTDFIALSGIELLCYPMLALGGDGHLSLRRRTSRRSRPRSCTTRSSPGDHERGAAAALRAARRSSTRRSRRRTRCPAKWIMHRMGILPSAFAREPLAALSEAGQARVLELLAGSPWMREVVAA